MPNTLQQLMALECPRTYYSTLHWKKIVNGYSAFFPASYMRAWKQYPDFPSTRSLAFFRGLGVRYIIVHRAQMSDTKFRSISAYGASNPGLKLVRSIGTDYVYQI